jgi:hypothetical protein
MRFPVCVFAFFTVVHAIFGGCEAADSAPASLHPVPAPSQQQQQQQHQSHSTLTTGLSSLEVGVLAFAGSVGAFALLLLLANVGVRVYRKKFMNDSSFIDRNDCCPWWI